MKPFRLRTGLAVVAVASALTVGCELFNPERPTMQPDTVVFGNLPEPPDGASIARVDVVIRLRRG